MSLGTVKSPENVLLSMDINLCSCRNFIAVSGGVLLELDSINIILTGNYSTEVVLKSLRAGADDYLQKPFPVELIISTIKKLDNI